MPRRTAPRCPVRGTAHDTLDDIVEANLTGGECFGHWDLRTRVEFSRPWAKWGDEITRRWRTAFPGSRPMAAYILSEIDPPTWEHELPALRRPLRRIDGCTVEILDTGWHKTEHELRHLVEIGLVDAAERRAAERRLADHDWSYPGRYSPIASE